MAARAAFILIAMGKDQTSDPRTALVVYQLTEEQLKEFALKVVEETRDSVAEKVYDRVSEATGNTFEYCTIDDACKATGMSERTIRIWVKKGLLRTRQNGSRVLYLRRDVLKNAKKKGRWVLIPE